MISSSQQVGTVKCGIEKYDANIFPMVEKNKAPFNFVAALFFTYWLPYKGLWKDFATWAIPFAILGGASDAINLNWLYLGITMACMIGVGTVANRKYYELIKSHGSTNKQSVWAGVSGLVLTMILFAATAEITGRLIGHRPSEEQQMGEKSNPSQPDTGVIQGSEQVYTQSSLAVMDGENAVGKKLKFPATYMGIQTIDGIPVIFAIDTQGGTQWWIAFAERYKGSIAQMVVGKPYTLECIIKKVETAMNVCSME